MADKAEDIKDNIEEVDKKKNISMSAGAAAAAVLIGAGYMIGQRAGESRSIEHKIRKHLKI